MTSLFPKCVWMIRIKWGLRGIPPHLNKNKNILILCTKGVNRSVSIAVGYAITRKGQTYEEISEYIEAQKKAISGNWDNLTNYRIRNLLQTLSNLRATLVFPQYYSLNS